MKSQKIKQYEMIRLTEEALKRLQKEDPCSSLIKKERAFIYLGEIPNMLGHCVVIGYNTDRIYSGCHTSDFRKFIEKEW